MTSQASKLDKFQRLVCDRLDKTNEKLDKLIALLVSQQLLQECVDPEGQVRAPEDCAEVIVESYSAGLCLTEELNNRTRDIEYQKSEFFVEGEGDEEEYNEEDDDDDDDDDELPPPTVFAMSF
jgi:hypothetical protein